MTDLNKDKKEFPQHNYVCVRVGQPTTNKRFSSRALALNYGKKKPFETEILTFKEAVIKYPEQFIYDYDTRGGAKRTLDKPVRKPRLGEAKTERIAYCITPSSKALTTKLKENGIYISDLIEDAIHAKAKELGIE